MILRRQTARFEGTKESVVDQRVDVQTHASLSELELSLTVDVSGHPSDENVFPVNKA
jgi:hypothetical protein